MESPSLRTGDGPMTTQGLTRHPSEAITSHSPRIHGELHGARPQEVPVLAFGSGLTALGVIRSFHEARIPLYSVCPPNELPAKSRYYRPAPGLESKTLAPHELV